MIKEEKQMGKVDYGTLKKGGFMRQKQKDNFSLRLAVTGGTLTAENLRKIAEVADKFGDGYVHLTSRQGVEIPFIKLAEIDEVKDSLAEGGCRPGVCGPRVRTVTACQGNQICPSGNIDSYHIAQELDRRYFGRELPHKFKFGVTGCQNNCLKAEENDVGVKGATEMTWKQEDCIGCGLCEKVCREQAVTLKDGIVTVDYEKCSYCGRCVKSCPVDAWDAHEAYILSFGGTFGNKIGKGDEYLPLIRSEEQLFRVTDAAIQFFADYANPGERFRFTIERVGKEKLIEVLKGAYNG
jgi:dissimilatory sulfite reductase (desulfoviridin) alpha/beta subunit